MSDNQEQLPITKFQEFLDFQQKALNKEMSKLGGILQKNGELNDYQKGRSGALQHKIAEQQKMHLIVEHIDQRIVQILEQLKKD